MTDTQKDALVTLASLSPQELAAAHFVARNAQLQAVEDAKDHPLRHRWTAEKTDALAVATAPMLNDGGSQAPASEGPALLPDEDFRALCDHMDDGGGALNVGNLRMVVHQAFVSRDQAKFWPALVDWFKAELKVNGNVVALPFGGVQRSGVA
jgi:hypothetical protein